MKRILLIDDDLITLRLSAKFLRNFGFDVEEVSDSKSALDKLMTPNFDIIVTEVEMTGLSGFDLVSMMKKYRVEVPVVFLTSSDDRTTRDEADNYGVTKLISKKEDYINLPHIIDNLLYGDLKIAM